MRKNVLRNVMIFILCCGILLLISGIVNASKEYDAPLYISQDFTISPQSTTYPYSFKISGKIKNRTSKDVTISTLTILCSAGTKNNTKYTATYTEHNIKILANEEISISRLVGEESNFKNIDYDKVSWVKCTINGTDYHIDFSNDGITFSNQKGYVISAVIGGIMCAIATAIIVLQKIKNSRS